MKPEERKNQAEEKKNKQTNTQRNPANIQQINWLNIEELKKRFKNLKNEGEMDLIPTLSSTYMQRLRDQHQPKFLLSNRKNETKSNMNYNHLFYIFHLQLKDVN